MPITIGSEPKVIFIKRADHLSKHGGQVAFPGGMWERHDNSLLETAVRESEEEIALPPSKVELIARLETVTTPFAVRVTPYVGFVPEGLDYVPEPSEIESIFQVPLNYLLEQDNYTRSRMLTFRGDVEVPCIYFDHYCIWGLTFHIMRGMFHQVFDMEPDRIPAPSTVKEEE